MIHVKQKHIRKLLHHDTPPCISLYMKPRMKLDEFRQAQLLAREYVMELLGRDYGVHTKQFLLDRLERAFQELRPWSSTGWVLFLSPEFAGWHLLPDLKEDVWVVADSFHFRPLEEYWREGPAYTIVHVGLKELCLLEGSSRSLDPVAFLSHQYERLDSLLVSGSLAFPRIIMVSGPGPRREVLRRLQRSDELSERCQVIDLGPLEFDRLAHIAPLKAKKQFRRQMDRELQEFYKKLSEGQVETSLQRLLRKFRNNEIRVLYAQKGRRLWGRIDWVKGHLMMSATQQNARDDDIVDDLIEEAHRRSIPVRMMNDRDWPLDSPVAGQLTA